MMRVRNRYWYRKTPSSLSPGWSPVCPWVGDEGGGGYRERVGRPEDRRNAIAADRTMRDNDGREVWLDTRAI